MNAAARPSLAVIPARGGSKRIPRKNIRPFCGRPMIAWSIQAALDSRCFDRVVVSTDDEEIAEVARREGAEVPFIRPAALSDDHTGTIAVIRHAIGEEASRGPMPGEVCCLYATAPFVRPSDLQAGIELLRSSGADFAFTATRFGFPIQRALRRRGDGRVSMFFPEHFATRSQDLEEAFHDAGQFYVGRAEAWLAAERLFDERATALLLPTHRVQDIDTLEDWERAELLFRLAQAGH